MKIAVNELFELFVEAGIDCTVFTEEDIISLSPKQAVNNLKGYSEGLFYIQDPTAAKAAKLLDPEPGSSVVDLCAAPGGKTMGLAIQMNDCGSIIATDIDDKRLEMVDINAGRLGVKSVKTVPYNEFNGVVGKAGQFDSVLIDVPCSNSGVMARRPEVKLRINEKTIDDIIKVQRELLIKAAGMVKTGGKICYSTCRHLSHRKRRINKSLS